MLAVWIIQGRAGLIVNGRVAVLVALIATLARVGIGIALAGIVVESGAVGICSVVRRNVGAIRSHISVDECISYCG